ncbi:MAG: hypothetical protein ACRD4Q_06185 [Candidatus Acidiferrales bacterium]
MLTGDKDSKLNRTQGIVTSTVELIVTPEMRDAIEQKRLRRQKNRLLGDEIHGSERGEVDLGDLDEPDAADPQCK